MLLPLLGIGLEESLVFLHVEELRVELLAFTKFNESQAPTPEK